MIQVRYGLEFSPGFSAALFGERGASLVSYPSRFPRAVPLPPPSSPIPAIHPSVRRRSSRADLRGSLSFRGPRLGALSIPITLKLSINSAVERFYAPTVPPSAIFFLGADVADRRRPKINVRYPYRSCASIYRTRVESAVSVAPLSIRRRSAVVAERLMTHAHRLMYAA